MEFQYQDYCVQSLNSEYNWQLDSTTRTHLKRAKPFDDDLRNEASNWWSVQRDLKREACVGYALATGALWFQYGIKGSMNKFQELPSMRFLWEAAKEFDDNIVFPTTFLENQGTSLKAALRILRKYGCLLEDDYTAGGKIGPNSKIANKPVGSVYVRAAERRIAAYFDLMRPSSDSKNKDFKFLDNVFFWLKNQGPVVIRVKMTSTLKKVRKRKPEVKDKAIKESDWDFHALCIVGIDNDRFILRNNWGTKWGDGGYAYVNKEYLLDITTEAYGIVIDPKN